MGVSQMASALIRSDRSNALHQDAGDDLETVGDPVLHLLIQQRVLTDEFVLLTILRPGDRHIRDRQQEPHALIRPWAQATRMKDQMLGWPIGEHQIHLVGTDVSLAIGGRSQQRPQLRHIPFAGARSASRQPGIAFGSMSKSSRND